MTRYKMPQRSVIFFLLLLSLISSGFGQGKSHPSKPAAGSSILWEPVNTRSLDLYEGPGGIAMRPDLSRIKLIKEEKRGHNKKFRISDGSGRIWVAKLGSEAQPETAAVRLLYGLGYKTEINYLVPSLTIPGKGTFRNVRLEARPDNVERLGEWKWRSNPFVGTRELQGLKMMMAFMTNWTFSICKIRYWMLEPKSTTSSAISERHSASLEITTCRSFSGWGDRRAVRSTTLKPVL